jgi:type IV pilus assembly protein PilC
MSEKFILEQKNNQELFKLLDQIGQSNSETQKEEVIYGVYDNTNAPITTQINDWLIDHSKVSLKDKAYFFHLMAVMIDSGIPLLQSLDILTKREKNLRFRRIIATMHHTTESGKTLSEAMSRFPQIFTDAEIGVVKSGEAVGKLNDMLNRLSKQLDKSYELEMKIFSASIYPIMVLGTLILVGGAMMIWILPNLLGILTESGLPPENYPLPTKILLGTTNFLTNFWWIVLIALAIFWATFKIYTQTSMGKFRFDYFKLRLPIVGSLLQKVYVLRFVSLLGILINAGLPVVKTLQIIAQSLDNELYSLKTWQIIGQVQEGGKISESLEKSPFLFPETVTHMLSISEKTAAIGSISDKISDYYNQEIDHSLKRLTSIFEPLMIIFVALLVALLALAVLLPIFQLTESV